MVLMMADDEELVTVVIAAYNAAATIETTLNSVRAQTHRTLEIIVVVDGATDATETLVRHHAQQDPRIVVIVTPNQGFCAARNTGAQAGTGAFIAPLDADDVWHPEKIRKQLDVFAAGDETLGMVYTLYRRIDQWGYLILDGAASDWSGRIFNALLLFNCVGTGSSMLIRSDTFDRVGGYSMELNRLGCEDYLLQILIAHDWTIGVVPEFLTGYRFVPGSMSRNQVRMAQARLKMMEIIARYNFEIPDGVMKLAQAQVVAELGMAHVRDGNALSGVTEVSKAVWISPFATAAYIFSRLRDYAFRFVRRTVVRLDRAKPPQFQQMDPRAKYSIAKKPRNCRTVQRLLRHSGSSTVAR